jgi:hypothetical protein
MGDVRRDDKVTKAARFCLIANALGLGGYLFFCSRLWADMPDGALYADDGPSAISWFFTALPFMAICTVLNVVVFVRAVRHTFIGKGWGLMATWSVMVGAWVLMQLYVRSHVTG